MRRKAEFIGMEPAVVHGQEVVISKFSSVTEPSLNYERTVGDIMRHTGERLQEVREKIAKYHLDMALWNEEELELDFDDIIDCAPTFDDRLSERTELMSANERDIADDVPLDDQGDPLDVSDYLTRV